MFDKPRNWKWMVPAGLLPFLLVWWELWSESTVREAYAVIPLGLSVVAFVAALMNGILYLLDHWADVYANLRAVLNSTPEVRMFEAAKSMHPETARALLVHRRTIWRLKYVPVKDLVDWVLDEVPSVHAGFIDFVLDHSSEAAIMPKRLLSDGSFQFDPTEQTMDYEQYDSLLLLMQSKLMITQAYGNQAPQWIPPWNPGAARHRFGLDGAVTAEPETMSETLRAVVRAQAKSNGMNGDLPKSQSELDDLHQKAKQAKVENNVVYVPALTEEEEAAIDHELKAYPNEIIERVRANMKREKS